MSEKQKHIPVMLNEVLAAGHLGLDDLLAVSSGVCQRLLGEYRLASLDSCQNRTLVELTRGGNDNCVYVRIVDCFVEVGVDLGGRRQQQRKA